MLQHNTEPPQSAERRGPKDVADPPDVLHVEDLCVRYTDGVQAIRGVSFSVRPSERVGLLGPNGAGKTTLMLAVMNAVRFTGRVLVDGVEVGKATASQTRSRCGMTFQDAEDHLFMPTLLDDVAFGPLNQGCDSGEAQRRSHDAIAQVGLAGLELRSAHHMSGGQKRAAALATVLAMQVKLLLLDEPAVNLDCRSRRRLIETLDHRSEAMLLATHDLPMIRRLASRVILLDQGQIIADRPAADLLADAALLAAHGLVD
jgi:cobalt/nickel transport system ATP-binding protein